MGLTSGTRVGPYEIVSAIGAGGMGEVYRAHDTKLNRDVAIKGMLPIIAQEPDRVARFEREAQLLASLNHPNIAAIYGFEEIEGAKYLVLEFVEGRPLSDLLRHGALPVSEATRLARQIADALAASHERGIIHRDLKPGNVMVTSDGQVKVLDFGLGKALDSTRPGSIQEGGSRVGGADSPLSPANSPTMTMAATEMGIILGTAGYMSPEQAKGRLADKRSDVWAFGCVLFEMLTGTRAFDGEDITETLAAIVRGEPNWPALPAGTPPSIRALIERCLVKNRADRLADMSIVRFILNEPAALGSSAPAGAPARSRSFGWPSVAAATAIAVLATAGVMSLLASRTATVPNASPASLTVVLPEGDVMTTGSTLAVALSSDGSHLAYTAVRDGKSLLFVRALSDPFAKVLEGTDGATSPFFNPTGEWIGFFAQGRVKKIGVGGAGLKVIADGAPAPRGGTWAVDDTIYYAPSNNTGLFAVPASGGTPKAVTQLDRAAGEVSHRWPQVLPDQKTVLFTLWTGPGVDERHVAVHSLVTGERHLVGIDGDTARYVAGHLFYAKRDDLFAIPWLPTQTTSGNVQPVSLAEHPRANPESTDYVVSENGTLAFLQGDPARHQQRVLWVDRSGHAEALPLPERDYKSVALSPDGRRAVLEIMEGSETLWMYEFARNTLTPFVTSGGSSQAPVWTPDNARVVYRGTRNGRRNLYWKRADGTGDEVRLTDKADVLHTPHSVSPDGEWLVFAEAGNGGASDIFSLRLAESSSAGPAGAIRTEAQSPARESNGRVSPDGHWLAYLSDASGRDEVFVQPFPGPGPATPVSTGGAREPIWSRDGRELFYVPASGDRLLVVDVRLKPTFSAGQPRLQYEGLYKATISSTTPYDVSPDGRRFLRLQQGRPDRPVTRIEVVLNWLDRLKFRP